MVLSGGNVGIGTKTPTDHLQIVGDLRISGLARKPDGGGWTVASDARLKQNVVPLSDALDMLLQLRGVRFEWRDPNRIGHLSGSQFGLVAQEVEKVFPEWVSKGPDGYRELTVRGFEALVIEVITRNEDRPRQLEIGLHEHEVVCSSTEGSRLKNERTEGDKSLANIFTDRERRLMNDSRLQIRRVHAQYLVPSDHPAPRSIKDRLDDEIRRSLSRVLCAAFSLWFSETDASLWFVRRLEVDLAVDAAGNGEHVARTLTRQLGRALGDALQDATDHSNVVRFASPAEYLAHFLSDLAAGYAWSRWYYELFFGLRMLPTSAALRTAVCDQAERGRAALLQLQSAELRNVLRALNRQDARLILESLTQGVPDDSFDSSEMVWSVSRLLNAHSLGGLDEWGRAIYLYLSVAREQKEPGLHATDPLLALMRCSPDRLRDIAQEPNIVQAQTRVAERERRNTSFGGAFLLLPLLDEIPLVEALRDWPHADEAAAISLVRFLLLIKCGGSHHAQRSLTDPLMRDILLVPPGVSVEVLREWQARVTATHIKNFLRTLVNSQRVQGKVADRRHILACAILDGCPVLVLIDERRAFWMIAQRYSPSQSSDLIKELSEDLSRLEQEDGILFCDQTVLGRMRTDCPTLKVLSIADAEWQAPIEKSIGKRLARLGELSRELSYLALPDLLKCSPTLDLALSVAAQHILRNFAWRLPGFGELNLPYLSCNFLDFPASVEEETTRRLVRLSSPPLRLVLGITGMMRQTYRLGWLDERPLTLFEES